MSTEPSTDPSAEPFAGPSTDPSTDLYDAYEAGLAPHRDLFESAEALRTVMSPDCDPALFAHWMLRYSAHGTAMTAPVESWITRAGEECVKRDSPRLGRALKAHARAEAGHDGLMVADAGRIAAWIGERLGGRADAEALLGEAPLRSTHVYAGLHEEVIGGATPQAQIAVEYEIERLAVVVGPRLLDNCRRVLGPDPSRYSFLAEHVELDVAHTAFNRRQMREVLGAQPYLLPAMTDAGQRALAAYGGFIAETVALATADVAAYAAAAKATRTAAG
ncbi:iron-containing redox enzyme family protein [Streptomyces sp. NPDC058953]|uniref:iron-containing redox enzyme family protein n=1 Tax=unclassified Streptomyces TaxID=2593676 RepID=UPI0036AA838E